MWDHEKETVRTASGNTLMDRRNWYPKQEMPSTRYSGQAHPITWALARAICSPQIEDIGEQTQACAQEWFEGGESCLIVRVLGAPTDPAEKACHIR